ncbi:MAG: hypothetical protein IJS07_05985 [Bacteroidales bacterium]|nr:hypothetical protein [Bacteroidales bacterium]
MGFRFSAVCFLSLCFAVSAAGQSGFCDFSFTKDTDVFLNIANPAALSALKGKLSYAELSYGMQDGAMVSLNESPDSWDITAGTESFCRVSDNLTFHGKLSWSEFQGKKMGGQILMTPDYNPVNFLENSDVNPGTKTRELYDFLGEMAVPFGERWSAGVGMYYEAGDYTKIKDPRFSSIWMDMELKAGVMFRSSEKLAISAALSWRNTLEQVKGHIYGNMEKQYYVSTDKGGFWGTVADLAGDYNYMPETTRRPMNNNWISASLQAIAGESFTSGLTFSLRDGYYGKKSSTSPTMFEFSGIRVDYDALLLLHSGENMQRVALSMAYSSLSNNENLYRYTTPAGGNTIVEYTGKNHVMDRSVVDASLDYRWYNDITGYKPDFTLGVSTIFKLMSQKAILYPLFRRQSIGHINLELFANKTFDAMDGLLDVGLSLSGYSGFGTKKDDGAYASTTSTSIVSFDSYLDRQFEFETAARAGVGVELTYTRIISQKFAPYVKISDNFLSLLSKPEYLDGATRNVALLTLGCNF